MLPPLIATRTTAPAIASGTLARWVHPRSDGRGGATVNVVSGSGSDLLGMRIGVTQPAGSPPVRPAEQSHQRGDHERAHERGVDDHRDGHADADRFDGDNA